MSITLDGLDGCPSPGQVVPALDDHGGACETRLAGSNHTDPDANRQTNGWRTGPALAGAARSVTTGGSAVTAGNTRRRAAA